MGREGEKVDFSMGCEKLKSAVKQGVARKNKEMIETAISRPELVSSPQS